jgi:hypothetical protein
VEDRIAALMDGDDPAGLGDRGIAFGGGVQSYTFTLPNEWVEKLFVVIAEPASSVTVTLDSENDAVLEVVNSFGEFVTSADALVAGAESVTFDVDSSYPFFVLASQASLVSGNFEISCDCQLVPLNDLEDGRRLTIGARVAGNMDIRGDRDTFLIDLDEGDVIEVTLDSGNFDAILFAAWQGANESDLVSDDDSGGGLLGLSSQLVFRAPYSGTFIIYARDVSNATEGGYVLTVRLADTDDPRALPELPEEVSSPFGPMKVHELGAAPFSVQYPAEWRRLPANAALGITAQFADPVTGLLIISMDDLTALGEAELSLEEYADLVIETLVGAGNTITSRSTVTTADGFTAERLELRTLGDVAEAVRLVYIHDGTIGISVTVAAPSAQFDESEDLLEYILSTFVQS